MAREHSSAGDPTSSSSSSGGLRVRARARGPRSRSDRPGGDRARGRRRAERRVDAPGRGPARRRARCRSTPMCPGRRSCSTRCSTSCSAETARPQDVPGGWRGRLEIVARENLALLRRHPWILEVDIGRPPLGPNMIAKYDYELRAVEGIGLTDLEMDAVVTLVLSHAAGAARHRDATARGRNGLTSGQRWNRSAPVLHQFLTPDRFPLAVRVGVAVAEADDGAPRSRPRLLVRPAAPARRDRGLPAPARRPARAAGRRGCARRPPRAGPRRARGAASRARDASSAAGRGRGARRAASGADAVGPRGEPRARCRAARAEWCLRM